MSDMGFGLETWYSFTWEEVDKLYDHILSTLAENLTFKAGTAIYE